jgi:hypothetical protein
MARQFLDSRFQISCMIGFCRLFPTVMIDLIGVADDFINGCVKVIAKNCLANTMRVAKSAVALLAKTIGDTDILQDTKNRFRALQSFRGRSVDANPEAVPSQVAGA